MSYSVITKYIANIICGIPKIWIHGKLFIYIQILQQMLKIDSFELGHVFMLNIDISS